GRASEAVADYAQGAYLRTDGRARRRADDIATGAYRRRAQLGLPLLLAARRDFHAARLHEQRLLRGGGRLARMGRALGGRQPRSDADHVRRRRRAPPHRVRDSVVAGQWGVASRAYRQRRAQPASTRRLRGTDRRATPGAQRRHWPRYGRLGLATRN